MTSVKVSYQRRTDGTELVNYDKTVKSHKELCELIDDYPWASEQALAEELGEGGGFYFLLGDYKNAYASYQLVPMEVDKGLLELEVVIKPGFLNVFGRKAITKHFDIVSTSEAKAKLKDLFDHSIEHLYKRYGH